MDLAYICKTCVIIQEVLRQLYKNVEESCNGSCESQYNLKPISQATLQLDESN